MRQKQRLNSPSRQREITLLQKLDRGDRLEGIGEDYRLASSGEEVNACLARSLIARRLVQQTADLFKSGDGSITSEGRQLLSSGGRL